MVYRLTGLDESMDISPRCKAFHFVKKEFDGSCANCSS